MGTTLTTKVKTEDKDTLKQPLSPSRLIGPEDVTPGLFVTIAEETDEYIVRIDADVTPDATPDLAVRAVTTMTEDAGWPSKVQAVSLPYVFVRRANRSTAVFDLRRHRLALLDPEFGKAVFKTLAKNAKRSKKRK